MIQSVDVVKMQSERRDERNPVRVLRRLFSGSAVSVMAAALITASACQTTIAPASHATSPSPAADNNQSRHLALASPSAATEACRIPFLDYAPPRAEADWAQEKALARWSTLTGVVSTDPDGSFVGIAGVGGEHLGQSTAIPHLMGKGGTYYDVALKRWLPVSRSQVSRDGSHYAYFPSLPPYDTIRIVDIASGLEVPLGLPKKFWEILDFGTDGIYLHEAWEGVGPGLWRLDPGTEHLVQVRDSELVVAVNGGMAWIEDVDPGAPAADSAFTGGKVPNRLSKLVLASGLVSAWITTPNNVPHLIGYDVSGNPIVMTGNQQGNQIWVTTGPSAAKAIGQFPPASAYSVTAFGDDHGRGIWLGLNDGLYLFGPAGMKRVAATSGQITLANRCV